MKQVYLAGAIWQEPVQRATEWRRRATALFGNSWTICDPTVFEVNNPDVLVSIDLTMIGASNIVLAKVDKASWGTAMEIRHAKTIKVPVIGWLENYRRTLNPWLKHHLTDYTSSLKDAIEMAKQRAL